VSWAVPLYWSILQTKLSDGTFKQIQLVGLDSGTMVGRPGNITQGRLEDLRLPNTVLIDDLAVQRLSEGRARPLGVGDIFEINDKEARVIGTCRTEKSFFSYPYVFTTYEHALQFAPKTRKMLSLVLVVVLHWSQFLALFSLGTEAPRFEIVWKDPPLPWGYVLPVITATVLFEVLPYFEELVRGLHARFQSRRIEPT